MTLIAFTDPPEPTLARALAEFEAQFTYPLGAGRRFRIEHGDDYARFYRAMGEARCFVRIEAGQVFGVLCVALRPALFPDGRMRPVGYIGDLKIASAARGGTTLHRLAGEAFAWLGTRAVAAFGVVMDGTSVVPSDYTGRAGIPPFAVVGHTLIYRLGCAGASEAGAVEVTAEVARRRFAELSAGRWACPVGDPEVRSQGRPTWLMLDDGSACGCLEDTRLAKRLIADDDQEMVSAHLSCFAFARPQDGARLLRSALGRAARRGYPALFVAVDPGDVPDLEPLLPVADVTRAPATVYGHGILAGRWNIHTSEV
jgi:hypothetical protein